MNDFDGMTPQELRSLAKAALREADRLEGVDASTLDIPPVLQTEEFMTAWGEWIKYRKERRLSTRPTTTRRQLAFLAGLGADGAVASINRSITNGWQGLFEAPGNRNRINVDDFARIARGDA